MEVRALTQSEQKYTYAQSMQLEGQTGFIGHLRGDFAPSGYGFYTSWTDTREQWKTDEFKAGLDEVINALREDKGLLHNRYDMAAFARENPESAFQGCYCTEYGFRVDTDKHAFLLRCNPTKGDYNFYCYCYMKERLDRHICKMLTEQLAVMIKEILDASKSTADDTKNDTEIDISELIEQMSEPYQMIAKSKGIRIEMDVSEKFSVHYPISMIRKVISNLLSNAVSYTPKGGTIKIYIEEQKLVLENECVPIPQEYQKHIFEPFYRFEYGGKDTKGNGLGLYIVDAVLRTLQIPYMFTALEDNSGMRFTMDFK